MKSRRNSESENREKSHSNRLISSKPVFPGQAIPRESMNDERRNAIKKMLQRFPAVPEFYRKLYSNNSFPFLSNWALQTSVYTRVLNTRTDDDDRYCFRRYVQRVPEIFCAMDGRVCYTLQGRFIPLADKKDDAKIHVLSDSNACSLYALNNCLQCMLVSQEQVLWLMENTRHAEYTDNAIAGAPLKTQIDYALLCHLARLHGIYLLPAVFPVLDSYGISLGCDLLVRSTDGFVIVLSDAAQEQSCGHYYSAVKLETGQWALIDSLAGVTEIPADGLLLETIIERITPSIARPGAFWHCAILLPLQASDDLISALYNCNSYRECMELCCTRFEPATAFLDERNQHDRLLVASLLSQCLPVTTVCEYVDDCRCAEMSGAEVCDITCGVAHPFWFSSQSLLNLVDIEKASADFIEICMAMRIESTQRQWSDWRDVAVLLKSKILRVIWSFTNRNASLHDIVSRNTVNSVDYKMARVYAMFICYYIVASHAAVQNLRSWTALHSNAKMTLLKALSQCVLLGENSVIGDITGINENIANGTVEAVSGFIALTSEFFSHTNESDDRQRLEIIAKVLQGFKNSAEIMESINAPLFDAYLSGQLKSALFELRINDARDIYRFVYADLKDVGDETFFGNVEFARTLSNNSVLPVSASCSRIGETVPMAALITRRMARR